MFGVSLPGVRGPLGIPEEPSWFCMAPISLTNQLFKILGQLHFCSTSRRCAKFAFKTRVSENLEGWKIGNIYLALWSLWVKLITYISVSETAKRLRIFIYFFVQRNCSKLSPIEMWNWIQAFWQSDKWQKMKQKLE